MAKIYLNKRPGLCEEADYFKDYLCRSNIEHFLYSWDFHTVLQFVLKTLFIKRSSLLLFIHEPFGVRHYLNKGDRPSYFIPYILLRELLVLIYGRDSCRTPSLYYLSRSKRFKYLPLVRKSIPPTSISGRNTVVMLGGSKNYRGTQEFSELSLIDRNREYLRFAELADKSTISKYKLLATRVVAVFNVYNVAYSISGVHLDALSHGLPLILAEDDFYFEYYSSLGFRILNWTKPSEVAEKLDKLIIEEVIEENLALYEVYHGVEAVKEYEKL